MQVKVRFFTSLREIVGTREETLTFPENKVTVDAVLNALSQKYGKPFEEYVYDAKTAQPKGFLQFLVNGNSTSTLKPGYKPSSERAMCWLFFHQWAAAKVVCLVCFDSVYVVDFWYDNEEMRGK